jgi:hypothetical protein
MQDDFLEEDGLINPSHLKSCHIPGSYKGVCQ